MKVQMKICDLNTNVMNVQGKKIERNSPMWIILRRYSKK